MTGKKRHRGGRTHSPHSGNGVGHYDARRLRRARAYRPKRGTELMPPPMPAADDVMSTKDSPHLKGTFANGAMYDVWADQWCERCKHTGECTVEDALFLLQPDGVRPRELPAVDERARLWADYTCTIYVKDE